jgi:co-chaperonin GroES (HSP10)
MKKNELGVIPVYGNIFVTADKLKTNKTEGGIIVDDVRQTINSNQRVLAVGADCPSYIKEDDIVVLNMDPMTGSRFVQMKYESNSLAKDINGNYIKNYWFPTRTINGREVLLISPRDIEYVIPVNKAHYTEDN